MTGRWFSHIKWLQSGTRLTVVSEVSTDMCKWALAGFVVPLCPNGG